MTFNSTEESLRQILTPKLFTSIYNLKWPWVKTQKLSGAKVGEYHFKPDAKYLQSFYDHAFHQALLPLSEISLQSILQVDLAAVLLPSSEAADFPEQSLGLITILDQARLLNTGYGLRYSRAFFDPIAEKLFRELTALSHRPDGKEAWTSRGFSIEHWLISVLWFWGPAIHSDAFMTKDRQAAKHWLHNMRREVEQYSGVKDPLAEYEASDDMEYQVFMKLFAEGPPQQSYTDQNHEATVSDYAFWCIRILNSHFAITDFAGRYPFWVRHMGEELSEKDRKYMEETNGYLLESGNDELFQEIRKDSLKGIWQPLPPNNAFEHQNGQARRRKPVGERGHGPVAHPQKSDH